MKKFSIISMIFVCCTGFFNACTLDTSGNGNLDGMWHLNSIDTINGGSLDMSQNLYFWSFSFNLASVRNANNDKQILFQFEHKGDSLYLSHPYENEMQGIDSVLTTNELLTPFGINATEEGFKILHLSQSKLTLQSKVLRLHLKKL